MHLLALTLVATCAFLLFAGFLYQCIGGRRDRLQYAAGGRWVTMKRGSVMYIVEKGSGGPTVIFEAGISATHLNWRHIQNEVSKFAFTASYDRCGLGWSSPCQTARTPSNICVELHKMLEIAGLKGPFVLVGHSFGGQVMRRYALLYPDDVAGVVLVDPMRCEEWPPLDPAKQAEINRGKRLIRYASPIVNCGLARLAVKSAFRHSGKLSGKLAGAAGSGGHHVLSRIKTEVGKMPPEVWPIVAAHWSRPAFYKGMRKHLDSILDTVREMDAAEPIRNIPVTVLTPGQSTPLSDENLGRIGDCAQQVIAPASAHWIHLDEPELVIESIRKMVAKAFSAETVTP